MKKLILALFILSACCDNAVKVEYKVVEKIITHDRDGRYIFYHLLLENGREIKVQSDAYANAKVGDIWIVTECK